MAVAVASVGLLAAPRVEALLTDDITVTVTIQNLSLSLSAPTVNFGTQVAGAIVQTSETNDIVVTNDGNVVEDFSLVQAAPTGWTAAGTATGETYVLSGLFVDTNDDPADTDFNAEDVIPTGTSTTATATVFGDVDLAGSANGLDVAINGTTDLWLELKTPTSTSVTTAQDIIVTVGAETS